MYGGLPILHSRRKLAGIGHLWWLAELSLHRKRKEVRKWSYKGKLTWRTKWNCELTSKSRRPPRDTNPSPENVVRRRRRKRTKGPWIWLKLNSFKVKRVQETKWVWWRMRENSHECVWKRERKRKERKRKKMKMVKMRVVGECKEGGGSWCFILFILMGWCNI